MPRMHDMAHLALDGHALRLLLTVLETGSVTAAARRLELTQSAVSHALDRLRVILGDPLFVKSGRGIAPTERARLLADQAAALLEGLRGMASQAAFEPATARLTLTVAANDLQRDLLLPGFFARVRAEMPGFGLRVIPSNLPGPELLRDERCALLVTPFPPAGTDILQRRLLGDHYACWYDPAARPAPRTRADYLAAEHLVVVHADNAPLNFDKQLRASGVERRVGIAVPSFAAVPAFLRGSTMLASLPSLLRGGPMRGFASVALPLGEEWGELPMFMAWHQRHQHDPAHQWLRGMLAAEAASLGRIAGEPQGA